MDTGSTSCKKAAGKVARDCLGDVQVRVELAGVGVSVVGPAQELLYVSVSGIRARATASSGRLTLEAAVSSLQVRNNIFSRNLR